MGYRSIVKSNVRKAFSAVKDLAIELTLTQTNKESFDFSTDTPITTTPVTTTIKAIELKTGRPGKVPTQGVNKTLLLNAEDIPDPDVYDSVALADGTVWKFVPPYDNNGYTITATISKEA